MDLYGDIPRLVLWRQILAEFFLIAHGETVSFVWHAVKPLGTQAVSKKRRCYWEQRPVLNLWMTSGGRLGWWVPLFFFFESGMGLKTKNIWRSQWKNHLQMLGIWWDWWETEIGWDDLSRDLGFRQFFQGNSWPKSKSVHHHFPEHFSWVSVPYCHILHEDHMGNTMKVP